MEPQSMIEIYQDHKITLKSGGGSYQILIDDQPWGPIHRGMGPQDAHIFWQLSKLEVDRRIATCSDSPV